MAFVVAYQHSANNSWWIVITGLSQSTQRSVYENEYVRNTVICVLVRIAQLVEHPAETYQLTFIKRLCAFESRKLLLLFSFLFIYNSFLCCCCFGGGGGFQFFIIACFFFFFYMFILFSVILFINIFNTFIQIKFAYVKFSWLWY